MNVHNCAFYAYIDTGGHPQLPCCTSVYKLVDSTVSCKISWTSTDVKLYAHREIRERSMLHVIRPYRNWLRSTVTYYTSIQKRTSTDVMLYVHIESDGRPRSHVLRQLRNCPRMSG